MKKPIFEGIATALITPITENGIDYDALGRLIDWQIAEGVNALVIAGTTGEGSTLTDEEHKEAIKEVMAQICRERDEYEAQKAAAKATEENKED